MTPSPIDTPRLALVPFTGELAFLALHHRARLPLRLGAVVPDEWPNREFAEILGSVASFHRKEPDRAAWSRLIVWREPRTLVGEVGAIDPPGAGGGIEIGYGVIAPWRGRGIATEALRGFCGWLLTQPTVGEITADTQVENVASARVLVQNGFAAAGTRHTEADGDLISWRRER